MHYPLAYMAYNCLVSGSLLEIFKQTNNFLGIIFFSPVCARAQFSARVIRHPVWITSKPRSRIVNPIKQPPSSASRSESPLGPQYLASIPLQHLYHLQLTASKRSLYSSSQRERDKRMSISAVAAALITRRRQTILRHPDSAPLGVFIKIWNAWSDY